MDLDEILLKVALGWTGTARGGVLTGVAPTCRRELHAAQCDESPLGSQAAAWKNFFLQQ